MLQIQALDHLAQDALGIRSRLACFIRLPDGLQSKLHKSSLGGKGLLDKLSLQSHYNLHAPYLPTAA